MAAADARTPAAQPPAFAAAHPPPSPARPAGYSFPYLYDASQDAARAYRVACTPEFFLFDDSLSLVYHGQFDDSRPKNGVPVTGGWVGGVGGWGGVRASRLLALCHARALSPAAARTLCAYPPPSARHAQTPAGRDLRAALDALLAGAPVPAGRPSIGWCGARGLDLAMPQRCPPLLIVAHTQTQTHTHPCTHVFPPTTTTRSNLKWHPGKEPEWYGTQQVQK